MNTRSLLSWLCALTMSAQGCVTDAGDEAPAAAAAQPVVVAAPPVSSSIDDVFAWCTANHNGHAPEFGGAGNPCEEMCHTLPASVLAIGGALASVNNFVIEQTHNHGAFIASCTTAASFDVAHIGILLSEEWCHHNPIQCTYAAVSQGICAVQECVPSSNPYKIALDAVCAAGPLIAAWYERSSMWQMCVDHLQREISAPIHHGQACMCDRQEFRSRAAGLSYVACGAVTPYAQVGTAAVNCQDHDSAWLAASSAACLADGASSGSTFYRYTNCRFVTNDSPLWCGFQNQFVQQGTDLNAPRENACVCTRSELTRSWAGGTPWACAAPQTVSMGTNQGLQQCAANEGRESSWLPVANPACGRPNGSTWYRYSGCRLVNPSDPLWVGAGLPAPTAPPVSVLGGPGCPPVMPPAPPAPPVAMAAPDGGAVADAAVVVVTADAATAAPDAAVVVTADAATSRADAAITYGPDAAMLPRL